MDHPATHFVTVFMSFLRIRRTSWVSGTTDLYGTDKYAPPGLVSPVLGPTAWWAEPAHCRSLPGSMMRRERPSTTPSTSAGSRSSSERGYNRGKRSWCMLAPEA